jgi:chromosome segregation ATPase
MAMSKKASGSGQQTIEQLQERYARLNKEKIEADTKLKMTREQLDELKRKAREVYGTDDLNELRTKLEEMKAANEQKRAAYQADLDRIEADLAQVEEKFASAEAGTKGTP